MDRFKKIIEEKNKKELIVVGLVVIGTIFLIFQFFGKDDGQVQDVLNRQESSSFTPVSEYGDLKMYFTKQINKKISDSDIKVKEIESQLDVISTQKDKKIKELQGDNSDLARELGLLRDEVESYKKSHVDNRQVGSNSSSGMIYDPNIIPSAHNYSNQVTQDGFISGPRVQGFTNEIEIVTVDLVNDNKKTKFKNINSYLPAGTHIRGIILGGVDAHTEVSGENKTRVVTIRLVEGGNIPNGFKGQMQNCVVLASAWGNASSERVAMRGERMSCVAETGQVLETDIVATVYGPDGRQDVRGRVVYPEAKLLQRAFLAGSLSGIGGGLANSLTTQSISPLGATNMVSNEDVFKFGAAQGVGKGLDKLADYYIKRAEQLQPIIQVGSGVEVDIVIQKGFFLDGVSKDDGGEMKDASFVENNTNTDVKSSASLALSQMEGFAK